MPHLHTFTHLHPALCTAAQQSPSEPLQTLSEESAGTPAIARGWLSARICLPNVSSRSFHWSVSYFSNCFTNSLVQTLPWQIKIVQQCQHQAPGNCYLLLQPVFLRAESTTDFLSQWDKKSPYIFNAFLGWNLIKKHQGEVVQVNNDIHDMLLYIHTVHLLSAQWQYITKIFNYSTYTTWRDSKTHECVMFQYQYHSISCVTCWGMLPNRFFTASSWARLVHIETHLPVARIKNDNTNWHHKNTNMHNMWTTCKGRITLLSSLQVYIYIYIDVHSKPCNQANLENKKSDRTSKILVKQGFLWISMNFTCFHIKRLHTVQNLLHVR